MAMKGALPAALLLAGGCMSLSAPMDLATAVGHSDPTARNAATVSGDPVMIELIRELVHFMSQVRSASRT